MKPIVNILNFLGYVVSSDGQTLFYQDLTIGVTSSVYVGKECSGLSSLIVFFSFFSALVFTFSDRILPKQNSYYMIIFLSIFALIISYISNLFRIVFIILSGHYFGNEALLLTHHYLGWILFTIAMSFFWYLIINIFPLELYRRN